LIFIDTGAFIARYAARDQHHQRARRLWGELPSLGIRLLTSNFVLDETFTLLARHTTYSFAAERARNILDSSVLEILRPQQKEEREAVELFAKYADQKVSFTDCVSFVLMRSKKIKEAFSFDAHFERAGFRLWRGS
jgi:predicted nucleic acid-binding protein